MNAAAVAYVKATWDSFGVERPKTLNGVRCARCGCVLWRGWLDKDGSRRRFVTKHRLADMERCARLATGSAA